MKYLFYGGTVNTGKTESVYRLTKKLTFEDNYKIIAGEFPDTIKDFQCVLEKGEIKILIHTHTDIPGCIKQLIDFYNKHKDVSLIITTVRDIVDPMRNRLFKELDISATDNTFEIPLGKVRRGKTRDECTKWYLETIESLGYEIVKSSLFAL